MLSFLCSKGAFTNFYKLLNSESSIPLFPIYLNGFFPLYNATISVQIVFILKTALKLIQYKFLCFIH